MSWIKKIAIGGLAAWFVICVLTFLAMALVPTWPSDWELPWSGFSDFALDPRGQVLVYIDGFDRVLRYSLAGEFLGSFRGAGYKAGRGRIATTADGRIVLEHMGRLRVLAGDGTLVESRETSDRHRSWVLDDEGNPVQGDVERRDPIRPAGAGDLLFGGLDSPARTEFRIDGATAHRRAFSISVVRAGVDEVTIIGTPWYLVPIRYPWPAAVSFVAAIFLSHCAKWLQRRRRQSPKGGA